MNKILEILLFCINVILLTLGLLSFYVISHEAYHYFHIEGQPTGICFGRCEILGYENITSETWAVSAVHWNLTKEQSDYLNANLRQEEVEAMVFGVILTLLLLFILFYLENKQINQQKNKEIRK